MYIEPNSTIKLFHDINLTRDYQNTLYFQNRGAQYSFFNTKVLRSYEDYTYVHKEGYTGSGYIEVTATPGEVWSCNYLAYNNTSFKDKWFYCFVDDIESVSNEVQRIHFTIDVLQTWLFDVTLKDSYIERSHTNDDGSNILFDGSIPAGMMYCVNRREINPYNAGNTTSQFANYNTYMGVVIQSTLDIEKIMRSERIPFTSESAKSGLVGGQWDGIDKKEYEDLSIRSRSDFVLDGCGLYFIPYKVNNNGRTEYWDSDKTMQYTKRNPNTAEMETKTECLGIRRLLIILSRLGWLDDIINMWIYPAERFTLVNTYTTGENTGDKTKTGDIDLKIMDQSCNACYTISGVADSTELSLLGRNDIPSTVRNKYANKKCLQYPYAYLKISNNAGSDQILHLELFNNPDSPKASLYGETGGDAKLRIRPRAYNEDTSVQSYTLDYALESSPLPMVTWANDNYSIWLAQNRGKIAINEANTLLNGIAGMVGGGWQYKNAESLVASGSAKEGGVTETRTKYYGVTGGINAGVSMITNMVKQLDDIRVAKLQSNTVHNNQSDTMNYQNGKGAFTQELWLCRPEAMEQIDKFLTMYGYKVAKVQPINLKVRENFTYIQTIGVCLHSSIPKVAEDEIRNIFDRGVTFWTNNDNIGDYSVSNAPIEEGE